MFLLLFLIFLLQILTNWIFTPLTNFVEYFLEIKSLPFILLLGFILLFSGKNIEHN